MKKSIFILLIIILVFLNCFLAFSLYQNKETDRRESNAGNEIAFRLIGDWKVKEYIGSALMARGHFFKEQYLGRSIFIDENTITQTLRVEGWPDELDDYTQAYSDCTIETMLGSDYHYAFENRFVNDTIPFDDENIELIIFRNKYKITDFVIAEDEVYYRFFDGLYLLEPFREAKTRISTKNLIGNWIVSGFVSYDSTWIGNKEQYELYSQGYSAHKLPYAKEQYGDFEINDYMGKEIEISKQTITCEWFDETYDNITVEKEDRKDFERYRQVHDKLGITNDTIEVFYLR